jgi:group I intron endonuclease
VALALNKSHPNRVKMDLTMPTTIYYIYRITNIKVNPPKSYIGFSKQIHKRFLRHFTDAKRGSKLYFSRALNKYGKKSFILEIIYCSKDKEYTLNTMEEYFIRKYNTHYKDGYGYNMTYSGEGGNTNFGKKMSEETKEKLRIAGKMRKDIYLPKSEETKRKMSEVQAQPYIIIFPDKHKEKISGLNQFCKIHHLLQSGMSQVASGRRSHHKGFKCIKITS